ncbi:MAG: hypothetical protein RSA62_06890, partial [Oscillospiraceae bacterium]
LMGILRAIDSPPPAITIAGALHKVKYMRHKFINNLLAVIKAISSNRNQAWTTILNKEAL